MMIPLLGAGGGGRRAPDLSLRSGYATVNPTPQFPANPVSPKSWGDLFW